MSVLTPHMGELARLLHKPIAEVVAAEIESTIQAAKRNGDVLWQAKVQEPAYAALGEPLFLNTAGNDKMATAGSGDVLTGMIAALMVQGMQPKEQLAGGYTFMPVREMRRQRRQAAHVLLPRIL